MCLVMSVCSVSPNIASGGTVIIELDVILLLNGPVGVILIYNNNIVTPLVTNGVSKPSPMQST